MKLTDRIRLLIACEVVLALLCTALALFQVNITWILALGLCLEGIILLLVIFQVLRPLQQLDRTLEQMNQEKEPSMERFHEIAKGDRIFTEPHPAVITNAVLRRVRSAAMRAFFHQKPPSR